MKIKKSLDLGNFLKPNRNDLGRLLISIYGACDDVSLYPEINLSTETELKHCAQILLLKLQEE
jgi:hypothetical protein